MNNFWTGIWGFFQKSFSMSILKEGLWNQNRAGLLYIGGWGGSVCGARFAFPVTGDLVMTRAPVSCHDTMSYVIAAQAYLATCHDMAR